MMKQQAWMTAAVAITAFGWPLSLKAQDQTPAPTAISIEEVGEVLARVNGELLLTETFFPDAAADRKIDLYQLRPWIEGAIDNELVAQKAVALGLDKDPEYLDQIAAVAFQAAWPERQMLVQLYLQTIPEVADAMNRESYRPTAEEIAAHMAQNQDEFARYPDEIRESFAVRQLTSGAIGAGGEARAKWLRQRLSTVTFTIQHSSGSATIQDAVPTEGTAVLLPKIIEIVVKREAKKRGVAPSAIKKDLALLTAALSEVVVEADGNSLTLGELPELPGLIAGLDKGGSVSPIVFNAVTNLIMIADAREAGLEKDPEFLAQQVRGAEAVDNQRAGVLAEFYFARHGMGRDDVALTDVEARAEYYFYMEKFNVVPKRGVLKQDEDAVRERIEQVVLRKVRASHLKVLRAAAEIELLVELP